MAELTGNPKFIGQAARLFSEAVDKTEENTSTRTTALMELQVTWRKRGEKIDWQGFTPAYQTVTQLSQKSGNWDRLAATSWWYTREALLAGRRTDLRTGLGNLRLACKNLGTNWVKYPLKEALAIPLAVSRRATYSKVPQYFEAAGH